MPSRRYTWFPIHWLRTAILPWVHGQTVTWKLGGLHPMSASQSIDATSARSARLETRKTRR